MRFELVIADDEIPQIVRDGELFARALTARDGRIIVSELNAGAAGMRNEIIDAVTDAIEQAFEGRE